MTRRRRPLSVPTVLLVLTATACVRSSPPVVDGASAADASAGPSPYRRACAACHGVDGRGTGPVGPTLRTSPTDLTLLAVRNGGVFPREAVVAVITGERSVPAHGTREMPVWSISFAPTSGPTAMASIVAQRRIDAIVGEVEALQRSPDR